jgi:hypothetical protein
VVLLLHPLLALHGLQLLLLLLKSLEALLHLLLGQLRLLLWT